MVCQIPFHRNVQNYENDDDHDTNTWKMWFVVFGRGLFTKKLFDAGDDIVADDTAMAATSRRTSASTKVMRTATRTMTLKRPHSCCMQLPAAGHAPVPKHVVKVDPGVMHKVAVIKAETGSVKCEPMCEMKTCSASVKLSARRSASGQPKRAQSVRAPTESALARVPSPKLPLYADDTDDDQDEDVQMTQAPLPISPTLTSVSSLSTTSLATSRLSSVSSRGVTALFLDNESRPAVASSVSRAPASSASRARALVPDSRVPCLRPPAVLLPLAASTISGTPSPSLLFNRRTRVLYNNPEATMEEMQQGDSMQVVEHGELAGWMSTIGPPGT
ncbi:hypothetical protein K438DRAFT_1978325 [Mycena galopus ATCC 62051]|nr:hypothetical protein K438DRAFT_1978325 [Mycena galopus ATCC 62051]